MKMLVTGAAGFIGSTFIREALNEGHYICMLDSMSYAGHYENISEALDSAYFKKNLSFTKGSINNFELCFSLLSENCLDSIVNFAAETHVDNSIKGPKQFIEANINGTFSLLEATRKYLNSQSIDFQKKFRFLHVSTDEVFGSLGDSGKFNESTSYKPNSPYSATKAASDHLVRAWYHTYNLPTIITNCSNNYGPRQFPEKLIPLIIKNALAGKVLPIYGTGKNIRDWIHVEDHSRGILLALTKGEIGESYCFGGNSERTNLEVVNSICKIMDELNPLTNSKSYSELISFVEDRAGHDWRYAIDDSLAVNKLGFNRRYTNFEIGLKQTVQWYLNNQSWVTAVLAKKNNS